MGGMPVSRLSASVILDSAPNYAPLLPSASVVVSGRAGLGIEIGKAGFFGNDYVAGAELASFDMRDPLLDLSASVTGEARFSQPGNWIAAVPRPVLVARPDAGVLKIGGGNVIDFPEPSTTLLSLDNLAHAAPADGLNSAAFVTFAGETFRALTLSELAALQLRVPGAQAAVDPEVALRFLARDGVGAISGDLLVRANVVPAKVSGQINAWGSDVALAGVTVRLVRSEDEGGAYVSPNAVQAISLVSDVQGKWTDGALDFARYNLDLQRVAAPLDIRSAVDASDVLAALKLATRRNPSPLQDILDVNPDPSHKFERLAADVDVDGDIDTADVERVLKLALGIASEPVAWRFVGSNGGSVSALDAAEDTQISVVAVLPGDVDGSWSNPLDPLVSANP
jgi:hypothetical protein